MCWNRDRDQIEREGGERERAREWESPLALISLSLFIRISHVGSGPYLYDLIYLISHLTGSSFKYDHIIGLASVYEFWENKCSVHNSSLPTVPSRSNWADPFIRQSRSYHPAHQSFQELPSSLRVKAQGPTKMSRTPFCLILPLFSFISGFIYMMQICQLIPVKIT